jgi:hypothetical protein
VDDHFVNRDARRGGNPLYSLNEGNGPMFKNHGFDDFVQFGGGDARPNHRLDCLVGKSDDSTGFSHQFDFAGI